MTLGRVLVLRETAEVRETIMAIVGAEAMLMGCTSATRTAVRA